MNALAVVVIAGLGSFFLRLSMVVLIDRVSALDHLERVAGYVIPAAFAGLAATALVEPVGGGFIEALPPVVAVVVTAAVALRHAPLHVSFLSGLGTLWTTTAVLALT